MNFFLFCVELLLNYEGELGFQHIYPQGNFLLWIVLDLCCE